MKSQIFIAGLIICCLYGCNTRTSNIDTPNKISVTNDTLKREELTIFDTLNKRQILKRLFDNPELTSSGMAIWKGNYSDLISLSTPLSYDGKFHTSMDTILYFVDTKKRKCAVSILSTYNFQYDKIDSSKIIANGCHFCGASIGIALFYQTEKKNWELYDFKKEITQLGYGGIYKTGKQDEGIIQLKVIGDKWTALSLTQGIGGNGGYLEGGEELFSIEQYKMDGSTNNTLKKLLSNQYNMKKTFLTKNAFPEISPIKRQSNYFDLLVRTIDNDTVKTTIYQYSPDCDKYVNSTHYR